MDQMIAANTQLQQRLEQAEKQLAVQGSKSKRTIRGRTDSLTVCRIAGLRRRTQTPARRMATQRHAVHLVLMDIDFFKKFNDTHGHQVGDEVLVRSLKSGQTVARDGRPCRYGGEEFAAILPATDAINACRVASESGRH